MKKGGPVMRTLVIGEKNNQTVIGVDEASGPDTQVNTLVISQTINTMAEFNQANREARLLNGCGLEFKGLRPGPNGQTMMVFNGTQNE
jgi:hypothetical protein